MKINKISYQQENWSLYQASCGMEKLMFLKIIKEAINYLEIPFNYKGDGRPEVDLRDIIKCLCIKTFSNYSS